MIPVDWLSLFVFFFVSYIQWFMFYMHEYGVEGPWSAVFGTFSEKVKDIGVPGYVVLVYLTITLGLKTVAIFLGWRVMNEVFGTLAYDETYINGIMSSFLVSVFFAMVWTKFIFTPPEARFFPALVAALAEFGASLVGVGFSRSLGVTEVFSVTHGTRHTAPFVLQIIYVVLYSLVITFLTFRCYFESNNYARPLQK